MRRTLLVISILLANFAGAALGQQFINFAQSAAFTVLPSYFQPGTGAMWSDVDAQAPIMWSQSDRLFVGSAAYNMPTTRTTNNTSWLSSATLGAAWLLRDAQMASMSSHGTVGLVGMSESKDGIGAGVASAAAVGVAGFAISNADGGHAWGSYLECQIESGSNRECQGAEIDVKNKGANVVGTPYSLNGGGHALWLAAGGDNSYGGVSANPSNAAIALVNNSNTWNTGILFGSASLTDGKAISMAQNHTINWYSGGSTISATLMSGSGSPAGAVSCAARCLYIRTEGGAGSTLYVNETGGGTSGWAAK